MVTHILEDPAGVAKQIVEEEWSIDAVGEEPDFFLYRDQNEEGLGLTDRGSIWLIEDDQERDLTADALRKHDDVRCPFKLEIHANDRTRMKAMYEEVLRIQRENLTDPGSNLPTPDTTFDEWELINPPINWEDRGRLLKLMNMEMLIWNQRIRD